MSNVIKGDCVLYSKAPRIMQLPDDSKAAESGASAADAALRSAFEEAAETRSRAKIEAHFVYQNAIREGMIRGRSDGFEKGRADGEARAKENIRALAQRFSTRMQALDGAYLEQMTAAREDCFEFAFGLAEEILGGPVDRDDYASLLERVLPVSPSPASLEADGGLYPFESCRGDILLQVAEELQDVLNMQGISLRAEPPVPAPALEMQLDVFGHEPQEEPEVTAQAELQSELLAAAAGAGMERAPVFEEAANHPDAASEWEEADSAVIDPQKEPEIGWETHDVEPEKAQAAPNKPQPDETAAETMQDEFAQNDQEPDFQQAADQSTELIDSEKFVFVRPARKAVSHPIGTDSSERQKFTLESLAALEPEHQKAVLRKSEIPDIAAAFTGADETTRETLLNAMPRRIKQNVLDAMHYLGPVSQTDTDAATNKLAEISRALRIARRGGEGDD